MSRNAAIARAEAYFDSGAFREDLARRVGMPTESQNPDRAPVLIQYIEAEIKPAFEALGFVCYTLSERNWPFLFAERIEDASRPTVLGYGHGDVIRGLDDGWDEGLSPWQMIERDGRWYGRGVADNKGQHSINIGAIRAVLETRGKLGFNAKYLIEMGEERISPGLREIASAHEELFRSDVLLASDGPGCRLKDQLFSSALEALSALMSGSTLARPGIIRATGVAFSPIRQSNSPMHWQASPGRQVKFAFRSGVRRVSLTMFGVFSRIARSRVALKARRSTLIGESLA
jgi:acetylornithine deacetylase/succinyl-diaminopimelate desuccinylase-like protein